MVSGKQAPSRRYAVRQGRGDVSDPSRSFLERSLNDYGRFRWVSCQLEILRRCFPSSIRDTLASLPKTLDATYEHTLLGIDEEKWQFAHRMFQCLAVSLRPLRAEELAEILAVQFDPGALPRFHADWRLGDAEEAVLSACSSLITVVNVDGFRVVQFAHFSVKEFLTSDRLSPTTENLSRYHIVPHFSHTTLAHASLSVLLELDDRTDEENIRNYPLADYAARHWLDHCQFGNVTTAIQNATKCLFDRARPYFSAWIWIYDIDDPWRSSRPTKHPEQPEATPLYYGILCGFPWLTGHLIATYPEDVNTREGYYGTPLLATIRKEDVNVASSSHLPHGASANDMLNGGTSLLDGKSHSGRIEIVQLLLEHGADVNLPNEEGESPLYWASAVGILQIVRLLVEWGADLFPQNQYDRTPVKMASHHGHLDVVRLLIDTGADFDSPDNEGWTPLHSASRQGHLNIVELLLEHGAAIEQQNCKKETPLHLACKNGKLEISHLLVERGADVHSRSEDGWTTLHMASYQGHLNVVQFLIDCGADVDARHNQGWTSLHWAAQEGYPSVVESLIEHGADIHKKSHTQVTPLNMASACGRLEIVRLLVEHGADVHSRRDDLWTPLKSASHDGHSDVVRFLINSGADVNAYDHEGWTPLHSASRQGHFKIVESLIQAGADVHQQNHNQETPLDLASASGELGISQLLVRQGAYMECRDVNGWTPLKTASHYGHLDVVQLLIDSGADLNPHDNQGWTPLHAAAYNGHLDVVELLLSRGACFSIRDDGDRTALDLASENGNSEVANFLFEHMAASVSPLVDDVANAIPSTDIRQNAPPSIVNSPPSDSEWEDVSSFDSEQCSVYAASRDGQLDMVRSLLDSGYDVNDWNTSRETALEVASSLGNLEIARLLIERGADVDSRDRDGWTPLMMALACGQLEAMRLLLDYGADVNARRRDGKTPLHCASFNGIFETVKLLLERGANVDIRNRDGQTPMQVAIQQGHRRIIELLREREQGITIQVRFIHPFDSYRPRITDTFPLPSSSMFRPYHLARTFNDPSTIFGHHLSGYSNPIRERASPLEFVVHTLVSISGRPVSVPASAPTTQFATVSIIGARKRDSLGLRGFSNYLLDAREECAIVSKVTYGMSIKC
jgi:ankyrin repeat protein